MTDTDTTAGTVYVPPRPDPARDAEKARVAAAVQKLQDEYRVLRDAETARTLPPVQADGRPLIVTIERRPPTLHRFALSDAALDALRGQSVPLTADGDHRKVLGRATIQRATITDGNLMLTATVEAGPHAPPGYLDALRAEPAYGLSVQSWDVGATRSAREVRVHTFWPGPGRPARPAEPDPFTRVQVACTACPRVVPDACQDEIESGLCLRCLNGGPPGPSTMPERATRMDDTDGQAIAEARTLLTEHGVAPDTAADEATLWQVLNAATPATREWMLARFTDGARCFIANHDAALRHWQGEAARMRAAQGETCEEVTAHTGEHGDIVRSVCARARAAEEERDQLRAEVHALERPHQCVASGMTVARCRDTDLCDCFGGQTPVQRLMAAENDARKAQEDARTLATALRVLAETWDTKGSGITSWTRAAADLRAVTEAGR